MINIDTRTAAQHRMIRYSWIALQVCLYAASGVALYFVLNMGL